VTSSFDHIVAESPLKLCRGFRAILNSKGGWKPPQFSGAGRSIRGELSMSISSLKEHTTATNEKTALQIRSLVAEHLGVDTKRVSDEARFVNDLGADWLDCLELMIAIEEDFGIEFPDDEIGRIAVVGDLIRFVEAHQRTK
jgi:acyl carrier protein